MKSNIIWPIAAGLKASLKHSIWCVNLDAASMAAGVYTRTDCQCFFFPTEVTQFLPKTVLIQRKTGNPHYK